MGVSSEEKSWQAWAETPSEPDLVSVVVPTYNRAGLIERALSSVALQTWRPIELIVCDDGSTDDTHAIVKSWISGHEGKTLRANLIKQRNAGASAARTRALLRTRGAYIQYLDSDDELHPSKFEKQVHAIKRDSTGFCSCRVQVCDAGGSSLRTSGRPLPVRLRPIDYVEYFWHTMAPLYTREVCMAVGPWPDIFPAEDLIYEARVKALGKRHSDVPEALAKWHLHTGKRSGGDRLRSARASAQVASALRELLDGLGIHDRNASNRLLRYLLRAAVVANAEGESEQAKEYLRAARGLASGVSNLTLIAARIGVMLLPRRTMDRLAHAAGRR
jgi:glycosyltransferase involved in cell wall biosynthesis